MYFICSSSMLIRSKCIKLIKVRVNEDACRCENNYDELVIDAFVESLLEQKRSSL